MSEFEAFLTPEITGLAVALLIALSFGGVIYALFQPYLSGSKRSNERIGAIAAGGGANSAERSAARDSERRRKSVQDQLKDFEEKQKARQDKARKLSHNQRLEQAGLAWSKRMFILISILCGFVSFIVGLLASTNLFIGLGFAFVGAFGLPRWYIARRRKKRFEAYLEELPNAVDVIVRGVKAGLPLADCIKIVARESREPVASEFKKIIEAQVMGITLTESVERMAQRVPLAETNFFAIVVAIQQAAGGGLSEALGNLSKVLRGRKAMKGKIKALSAEAKASAGIIGSLPIIIGGIMYMIAPDYMGMLFTRSGGHMIIVGSIFWMFCGVMVMRKMINFDF